MLFQLTSIIPGVRRHDSAGKSKIGSRILTSSEIAIEKELWSLKSEGIMIDVNILLDLLAELCILTPGIVEVS